MEQDSRKFLFIALVGLLMLYFWWQERDYQKRLAEWAREHPEAAEKLDPRYRPRPTPSPEREALPASAATPETVAALPAGAASLSEAFARAVLEATESTHVIATRRMRLTFSSRGGRLVSARLLDYPEIYPNRRFLEIHRQQRTGAVRAYLDRLLADQAEHAARLAGGRKRDRLDPADPADYALLADTGVELVAEGQRPLGLLLPDGPDDGDLPYTFHSSTDADGRPVLSMLAQLGAATLEKRLTFPTDGYEIGVFLRVETAPGLDLPDEPLALRWEGGVGRVFPEETKTYHRAIYSLEGDHEELPAPSVEGKANKNGGRYALSGSVKWAGVDSRYFMAAFLSTSESNGASFDAAHPRGWPETVRASANLALPFNEAAPEGGRRHDLRLYLGPRDYDHLKATGIGLEDSLYGGITGPICILMLWILNGFHYLWPNYGMAILLLTIVVRLAMFPLVHKQTQAMRRMQKLSPLIKDIQARHKDNPQQAQKEQFELFRKHKVNPMSGCLPLIATLPIFIALYYTTQNTIGLRGEPFFLWMRDLSEPDTLWFLPFQVPFFGGLFDINPLPLAGAILMGWQMAQTNIDPKQKPMMAMMPVMMLLITWRLPSGTNLYFMMSSLFQMGQQWLINRIEKDEPAGAPAPATAAGEAPKMETRERPAREKIRSGRTKSRK
ncbi:YidC/Oxa1 family insertase periplasmic-domain containing protein [bacterium]|nr:YidC/Oxa1 family insertase periplasmic-domain containing protein [bacterium]